MTKPDFSKIMEMAEQMKANVEKTKENLEKLEAEGEAGAGLIKVRVNGTHKVTHIFIDPRAIEEEGIEAVQVLLMGAINSAIDKVKKMSEEQMVDITKEFSFPDLFPSKGDNEDDEN
jgi:nucleoid-associated protein EbfC